MLTLQEELRQERIYEGTRHRVLLCGGIPCVSAGCRQVLEAVQEELAAQNMDDDVVPEVVGCIGNCSMGPAMVVLPEGFIYMRLSPADARRVIVKHVKEGRMVTDLLHRDREADEARSRYAELPFYREQERLVLRNCGVIRPDDIEEYMKYRGYAALIKALAGMSREEVVAQVLAAGLRGRGGGGFLTGRKWELALHSAGQEKYIVCNADEGDPGAFMDRSILEGDPHSVLEGMLLAGYGVGAAHGYIYVRAEYPLATERVEEAIRQAREKKLLGENILDKGFSFDIEIRTGAGAFVCGEETALISSLQGRRGDPRPRPPFPTEKGLWQKPTVINNVETLANIPLIVLHGAERFRETGPADAPGTKVFALAGNVTNAGLVEVPMGTSLRKIIYDIGGGIPEGKSFKAAQTGGPSGGCLPADLVDIPMTYESLAAAGTMMGSGGLIIMDEDSCMVDIARFYMEFSREESCGKCTACRVGTTRMLEILSRITAGDGGPADLQLLEKLALLLKNGSLCGLGRAAPNPVLSTMHLFRDEYMAHITDKHCPAGVCTKLASPVIDPAKCKACGLCAGICPAGAVTGERGTAYRIDSRACINCADCIKECPFEAIRGVSG